MIYDQRPMQVYADGVEVAKDLRKYLRGKTVMSLMPDFYVLDISGLSDNDLAFIRYSKQIKVVGEDKSVLCIGSIEEIYQHQEDMIEKTTIALSDGMDFWETVANASIGKGASVRSTMGTLLSGFSLGSFIADDNRFSRGQAYCDRLPDVISTLAKSVNARAFYTQAQVHVVKKGAAASIIDIPDKEILNNPGFSNGVCTLKTKVKGYPVGLLATIEGKSKKYRIFSQSINADCWEGDWVSELLLVDENEVDDMGGG